MGGSFEYVEMLVVYIQTRPITRNDNGQISNWFVRVLSFKDVLMFYYTVLLFLKVYYLCLFHFFYNEILHA